MLSFLVDVVASAPVVGGKPMFQNNPQHTGVSPDAGPKSARVLARFDTRQPGEPHAEIQSAVPIAPDGTAYVGNFRGTFSAVKAVPGST